MGLVLTILSKGLITVGWNFESPGDDGAFPDFSGHPSCNKEDFVIIDGQLAILLRVRKMVRPQYDLCD